jgi:hypothetical protein
MMAPLHSFQLPTLLFEQPSKLFPRNTFHTATSKILSFSEISCSEISTDKQASTAS